MGKFRSKRTSCNFSALSDAISREYEKKEENKNMKEKSSAADTETIAHEDIHPLGTFDGYTVEVVVKQIGDQKSGELRVRKN